MYEVSVSLVSCALKRTSEISNLEMAELSCIDVVKTARTRAPSRSLLESQAESPMRPIRERVSKPPLNHLYDIEVIEEERYKVKVHYIGYSSKYDEWIRKSEIAYKPTPTPTPQEDLSLLSALACSIKQKLVPSRKIEDPAVRIQLPFDSSTFQLMQQKGKPLGKSRGHTVVNYSDLNELLGERWHIRITNINGDFYVFPRDMCSPEGIYVPPPPVAVICVPQGYVFPRLQGQVQGRHLHPRGETVHHGAVPDLALMDAAGTSQPHVCI